MIWVPSSNWCVQYRAPIGWWYGWITRQSFDELLLSLFMAWTYMVLLIYNRESPSWAFTQSQSHSLDQPGEQELVVPQFGIEAYAFHTCDLTSSLPAGVNRPRHAHDECLAERSDNDKYVELPISKNRELERSMLTWLPIDNWRLCWVQIDINNLAGPQVKSFGTHSSLNVSVS